MKLTAKLKLQPTPEQFDCLLATLNVANQCCNAISETAFRAKTFKQFALHKLVYKACRQQFHLSAQMVIRAIAKVADSYKISRKKQRGFSQRGAFPYDARILSFSLAQQRVSIWTVAGRQSIPYWLCAGAGAAAGGAGGGGPLLCARPVLPGGQL